MVGSRIYQPKIYQNALYIVRRSLGEGYETRRLHAAVDDVNEGSDCGRDTSNGSNHNDLPQS